MKSRSRKLKYGSVKIPKNAFEDRNVKVRVSMMLPADVLKELKHRAASTGVGYQILAQQLLRDSLFAGGDITSRVERIEKMLKIG